KYMLIIKTAEVVLDEMEYKIKIMVPWFMENFLKEFLEENFMKYYKSPERKPKIIMNDCGSWTAIKTNYRTLDSVFLPKEIKDSVIEDINNFIKNKDKYVKNGLTWSRKYLLDGLPGTGKTSFVIGISEHFRYDIYYI